MKIGYLSEVFASFQGEGAWVGRRQLFVRTAGCHLRCRYCDTPDSLQRQPSLRVLAPNGGVSRSVANPVTAAQAMSCVQELLAVEKEVDGVSLTGGEPLLQVEFLHELLQNDGFPRPRLLETSGTHPDRLRMVLPWIDLVSMDIKLPSNTGEAGFWNAHQEFLSAARGKAYVKILVDNRTEVFEVERAAKLVRAVAPETPVFLQPISGPALQIDLNPRSLGAFFSASRRYLDDVRVVPQIHKLLGVA